MPDAADKADEDEGDAEEGDAPEDEALPDADQPTAAAVIAAQTKLPEPLHFEMRPAGTHPLLEGVNKVSASSEYLTAKWDGWAKDTGALELAHDPESGVPVLWLLPEGKGQIIVGAYGSILGNKLLGEDDNARSAREHRALVVA